MCGYIIAKPFCVAYAVSIKQNLSRLKKEVDLGLVSVFGPWTEKSKIVRHFHSSGSCRNTQRHKEGVWRDRKQSRAQVAMLGLGFVHSGELDVCYSPPLKGSA